MSLLNFDWTAGLVNVTKKQVQYSSQYSPTTTTNIQRTTTDARVYAPSYQIQIDSPYASQTKKDVASSSPVTSPQLTSSVIPSISTGQTADQSGGINWLQILLIGGIVVIGGTILIKAVSNKKK